VYVCFSHQLVVNIYLFFLYLLITFVVVCFGNGLIFGTRRWRVFYAFLGVHLVIVFVFSFLKCMTWCTSLFLVVSCCVRFTIGISFSETRRMLILLFWRMLVLLFWLRKRGSIFVRYVRNCPYLVVLFPAVFSFVWTFEASPLFWW
jgi:ABC-type amino acid transport system permease subunit